MGLSPNLQFIMKAQCLYTNLPLWDGSPFWLQRVRKSSTCFHLLGRYTVAYLLFFFHIVYDLEIRHHVFFFFPRPDVLSCYVKSSWHAATKWKQLLVLILLHIFITRYIPCILIPPILPSLLFLWSSSSQPPTLLLKKAYCNCMTVVSQ